MIFLMIYLIKSNESIESIVSIKLTEPSGQETSKP